MWLSTPLNRIGLTLMLSSLVFSIPGTLQVGSCDPMEDLMACIIEPSTDQPAENTGPDNPQPTPITVLRLLQVIDESPKHLVVLPSGKKLSEKQLNENAFGALQLLEQENWKSPGVSIRILQALGWEIDVTSAPNRSKKLNNRKNLPDDQNKRSGLQIVVATPPEKLIKDHFQSVVIQLKYADLAEVTDAIQIMTPVRKFKDFSVMASATMNSIVLSSIEPMLIKRCRRLIEQMENVAKQQQAAELQGSSVSSQQQLSSRATQKRHRSRGTTRRGVSQRSAPGYFSRDDLISEKSLPQEDGQETFESAGKIISEIIQDLSDSDQKPEILSASSDKRRKKNSTAHSYTALFALPSFDSHLAFVGEIRKRAPHLIFDSYEINFVQKKSNEGNDHYRMRLKLVRNLKEKINSKSD